MLDSFTCANCMRKPHHTKTKAERKARENKSVLDLSSTYRNKYKGFFTKETTVIKFVSSNPSGERRA